MVEAVARPDFFGNNTDWYEVMSMQFSPIHSIFDPVTFTVTHIVSDSSE
jgi:hypothetical protein